MSIGVQTKFPVEKVSVHPLYCCWGTAQVMSGKAAQSAQRATGKRRMEEGRDERVRKARIMGMGAWEGRWLRGSLSDGARLVEGRRGIGGARRKGREGECGR